MEENIIGSNNKTISIHNYYLLSLTASHTMTHVIQRVHTVLFPIFRTEFNLSLQQLGIIAAIPPIVQSLLSIPAGVLSDRIRPKIMISFSLLVAFCGALIVSQASNANMLTLGISLLHMNGSIFHPPAYSLTADIFRGKDRSKAFGIFSMGERLSTAMGLLSLSILISIFKVDWRYVYLFWAIPILISIFSMFRLELNEGYETGNEYGVEEDLKEKNEPFLLLGFIIFLVYTAITRISGSISGTLLPFYFVDEIGLDVSQISILFTFSSLSSIASSPLGGYFSSRFGDRKWLLVSRIINVSLFSLLIISTNVYFFIIVFLLYGFSLSLSSAARASIIARLTPVRRRGLGFSIMFIPGWIMGSVGAFIGTSVAELHGLWTLFPLSIGVSLMGIVIIMIGIKPEGRSHIEQMESSRRLV